MIDWTNMIAVGLALSNLALLVSSRLNFYVRVIAFQGVLLGFLPVLSHPGITARVLVLSAGTILIKAMMFPFMLSRVIRDVNVRREVEPFIGYGTSLLVGILSLLFAQWISARLPIPETPHASLVVPVAFFTILVGLLLIVSRKKAVTHVMGYIVMENGIYAFGAALVPRVALVVELGILLDAFVAVFVMGIIIFHINEEFDHIDTSQLSMLKDWPQ